MNILLSIHHYPDPDAGAPGVTVRLASAFRQLGHRASIYSFQDLPSFIPDRLKPFVFPAFLAKHISTLVRDRQVDVVDASSGDASSWVRTRPAHGWPLLVTRSHGLEHCQYLDALRDIRRSGAPLSLRSRMITRSLRLPRVATSMRRADLVLMLNEDDLAYGVREIGIPRDRVRIVRNGMAEEFVGLPFAPTPMSANEKVGIAVIAAFAEGKGIRYSVPALDRILSRHANVRVGFFGTGHEPKVVLREFGEAVRDRVLVIPRYAHAQLPSLLTGYQIKVLASIREGFGIALVEAMACGLAPVASDISGPRRIVDHERDGLLFPPRDSRAIELAIERLINNRAELDAIRRRAHQKVQGYRWIAIARETLALYQEFRNRRETPSRAASQGSFDGSASRRAFGVQGTPADDSPALEASQS